MWRVLVLETDETLRRELLLGLHKHAIEAESFEGIAAAGATLREGRVDTVLLGPGAGPVRDVLYTLSASPSSADIVAVIDGDGAQGLDAIRAGAVDFVPLSEGVDGVALALRKLEARRSSAGYLARAGERPTAVAGKTAAGSGQSLGGGGGVVSGSAPRRVSTQPIMVGDSPKIAAVMTLVRRLAPVRTGVLVGGESGTGKELVAQALHDQSPWGGGPFIAVNCGAIPAGLIESELFGHVRGSFTDAVRDKRGLFEAAHGGTLFLDEIADLPLGLQAKLLRAVQDGVIRKVGDVEDLRVEVRVVAATARDLVAEVRAGRFREDLYYRLAGLSIEIPPLRERREDIPVLAAHFLARARARLALPVIEIDPEALRLLGAYSWPGNVRELENTIERAAVLCAADRIDVASLPERFLLAKAGMGVPAAPAEPFAPPPNPEDLSIKRASRRSEEKLIRRALAVTAGNRTRAAELLQISHRALLYKIKEYEIAVRPSGNHATRRQRA